MYMIFAFLTFSRVGDSNSLIIASSFPLKNIQNIKNMTLLIRLTPANKYTHKQ